MKSEICCQQRINLWWTASQLVKGKNKVHLNVFLQYFISDFVGTDAWLLEFLSLDYFQ